MRSVSGELHPTHLSGTTLSSLLSYLGSLAHVPTSGLTSSFGIDRDGPLHRYRGPKECSAVELLRCRNMATNHSPKAPFPLYGTDNDNQSGAERAGLIMRGGVTVVAAAMMLAACATGQTGSDTHNTSVKPVR